MTQEDASGGGGLMAGFVTYIDSKMDAAVEVVGDVLDKALGALFSWLPGGGDMGGSSARNPPRSGGFLGGLLARGVTPPSVAPARGQAIGVPSQTQVQEPIRETQRSVEARLPGMKPEAAQVVRSIAADTALVYAVADMGSGGYELGSLAPLAPGVGKQQSLGNVIA